MQHPLHILVVFFLLAACATSQDVNEAGTKASASTGYDAAIERLSTTYFNALPEAATYLGAPAELAGNANARLNDRSAAGNSETVAAMATALQDLQRLDESNLTAIERRTRRSIITLLEGALEPSRTVDYGSTFGAYGVWYLPYAVTQNSGPTVEIPSVMSAQQAVTNSAQAEDYLTRLEAIAPTLDDTIAKLQADVAKGAIAPDFILQKARAVTEAFAATAANKNSLYTTYTAKLAKAGVSNANELSTRALAIVEQQVRPAYRRVSGYLKSIEADAPHYAGVWRLPNGDALYRATVRHMTDAPLEPRDLHEKGVQEVERIVSEMDQLLRAQGYLNGSVGERMATLGTEARFTYPNNDTGRAAILSDIQQQMDGVNALLPDWFDNLPTHQVEVRRVPAYSQDSAPGGFYDGPAPDGSRPGIYWINLRDTAIWPRFALPTLTYHEAIPGHHMQVAIALEQKAPLVTSALYSNPMGEGWGLYAEALAAEMGLYDSDPFGNLGRLQDELHRAIRLVVDTGMHAMKWSRERAIDYMVDVEGIERSEATSEIERYVVWPGQALGYKIGMLKIQALRREAETTLGEQFNIKAFHDQMLTVSSLALPIVELEMRQWIAAQRK